MSWEIQRVVRCDLCGIGRVVAVGAETPPEPRREELPWTSYGVGKQAQHACTYCTAQLNMPAFEAAFDAQRAAHREACMRANAAYEAVMAASGVREQPRLEHPLAVALREKERKA